MTTFEIANEFLLNQQPFKILSGTIHYFRVHPTDWYHSLYNLKALGFNTVETYVAWNLHEAEKGNFCFSDQLDIERFLDIAQQLGLYAIVRPSPYICAEWEFGGLPAWLLKDKTMRIRSSDPVFLDHVESYYAQLLPRLKRHQLHCGGNILMFQVENEYGSYGEDKIYLQALMHMMKRYGLSMPLCTSDGAWEATLRAGSLIEQDVLVTGNFGSKAKENFKNMEAFFNQHGKKWPLMCMEFWDGWFNRWGEEIIKRDPEELAEAVHEAMELGSVNLYMFHGGTNFGFMNGCSARKNTDLPQITSYDYDALLDEQGNPTPKYVAVSNMLRQYYPHLEQQTPLYKKTQEEQTIHLENKVSLFEVVADVTNCIESVYPLSMEELNQTVGYTLYSTVCKRDTTEAERYRVIDASDRVHFYVNGKLQQIQYREEIGEDIFVQQEKEENVISVLVENMGRVNYGHRLLAASQRKGIRGGVMADLHFMLNWKQYPLALTRIDTIDFSKEWREGEPSFYQFKVNIDTPLDAYIDMTGFGKGVVLLNGINIGRYWEVGPILSLYAPHGLWREGENEIVVFETEGTYQQTIAIVSHHVNKGINK